MQWFNILVAIAEQFKQFTTREYRTCMSSNMTHIWRMITWKRQKKKTQMVLQSTPFTVDMVRVLGLVSSLVRVFNSGSIFQSNFCNSFLPGIYLLSVFSGSVIARFPHGESWLWLIFLYSHSIQARMMVLYPLSLRNMENTEWSTTELPSWKRSIQASTLKVWREKSHVIPELEEQQAGMFLLGTCYAKKLFRQWNVIQNSTTFIQLLNFSLRAVYQVIFVSFLCSFVRSSLFIHSFHSFINFNLLICLSSHYLWK